MRSGNGHKIILDQTINQESSLDFSRLMYLYFSNSFNILVHEVSHIRIANRNSFLLENLLFL